MEILVCVKRVPMVGGRIVLTDDARQIDTEMLGFTISPHEECAVEEAARLVAAAGQGSVTVLTLGPEAAAEQLRDCLAVGASRAIHLLTDGAEWGPIATAGAIVEACRDTESEDGGPAYDLLLFGNEAADSCDYQVPMVAHMLRIPCATGVKALAVVDGVVRASREYRGVTETFELPQPCLVSVKEGINLPRYPSLPGRLRAKKAPIEELHPIGRPDGLTMTGLRVPALRRERAEVLGEGVAAVPALVALLVEKGIVA